ncbi:patatin-like phospholipase family protein [Paenibacillus agaridevorans]|uniref:patatin-like phospholipase family protein n=1 Tax=Paenibacillus agaridevorans TaxID=171404 RepID=UPI001BE49876|nr:patatin-like phospholipase family protein [Paenibacillus agaridevorans]
MKGAKATLTQGEVYPLKFDEIRDYPLLIELEQGDLQSIYPYLTKHSFTDGMIILKQGQSSEVFHIVLSGKLDVYLENEKKILVANLERGHFVGEMSCLTGKTVSATVKAVGTVETVAMPRQGLLLLMDRSTTFRQHMTEAMIKRIQESNDRVAEEYTRSLAVMRELELERQAQYGPLVGSSKFMHGLRRDMTECAQREDPVCIVGEKGVGKSHVAYEIHRLSRRAEYPIVSLDGANFLQEDWDMKVRAAREGTIVLENVDSMPMELVSRLLQSSENTRILMTACDKPDTHALEVKMIPLRERKEDIPELVHTFLSAAGSDDPQELISHDAMNMMTVYPYLDGNVQELKTVVQEAHVVSGNRMILKRHLRFGRNREPGTRPRIGLALGSGAARGAAHVGVIKLLEQEGIPIDIIAGTSVGAFIGALYAGGQPVSAFEKVLPTVRWGQLVNFVMPPKALVSNHPMARFVEKYIGPVNFEDLPIPFAAVAADAVSGEAHIFNKGRVSHAICASTAIPGFIKPVQYQQRYLVDGAVVHPVPVALTKSMGADVVIAVDLSTPVLGEPKSFVVAILNTIEIMSRKIISEEAQIADVVLRPEITTNQVSFKLSNHNMAMGEKAAREALTLIRSKLVER